MFIEVLNKRMQRRSILITFLALITMGLFLWPSSFMTEALATAEQDQKKSPYFFTDSQISFEDGLLSVDLKDASVENVLLDLSRKAVFELTILGDLKEHITVSFKHFSLKEGLNRMLGLADVNHAIICGREHSLPEQAECRINKLVVIARRELDSAHKAQTATGPIVETKEEIPGKKPTTIMNLPSEEQGIENAEPPERIFEGSGENLKNYLDDLAKTKRISPEEYEMIKKSIDKEKF